MLSSCRLSCLTVALTALAAAFSSSAAAQDVAGPSWSAAQLESGDYFFQQVAAVGHALQVDFATSNQCDTLLYARVQATSGAERLMNAAMWTAYVVRGGDLRTAGAEVTPEDEQLIRIPITPNGLESPIARQFFERMAETPGGVEARTADCSAAFYAAAGPNRSYFEQRANRLAGKN